MCSVCVLSRFDHGGAEILFGMRIARVFHSARLISRGGRACARKLFIVPIVIGASLAWGPASGETSDAVASNIQSAPAAESAEVAIAPRVDIFATAMDYADRGSRFCADPQGRPESFWREAYFSRAMEHQCNDALTLMNTELGLTGEGFKEPDRKSPAQIEAFRAYTKACIVSLGSVTDPRGGYDRSQGKVRDRAQTLTKMLGAGEVGRMVRSIGSFGPAEAPGECTASIVVTAAPARFLATAAHCVTDVQGKGVTMARTAFGFRAFSGWTLSVDLTAVAGLVSGKQVDPMTEDAVMIPIPNDVALPEGVGLPVVGASPAAWTPIYIVGNSPYLRTMGEIDKIDPAERPMEYVQISFSARCVLKGSKDAHMYYGCQTQEGMSGGPILVFRDGRVQIAGIHDGGRRHEDEVCGDGALPTNNHGMALIDHTNP